MPHRITVEPEHRGGGRYTWNWSCSCQAKGYGHRSRGAAQNAANDHLRRQGAR